MASLEGKVAFITGVARGQGRAHAVMLAREGAAIVGIDLCAPVPSVPYPMSSPQDLADTEEAVRSAGGQALMLIADVCSPADLNRAVAQGQDRFGFIDIVVANAGVAALSLEPHPDEWATTLDINLTGVYNTVQAALPAMPTDGSGGSIILTSSTAGLSAMSGNTPGGFAYTAAKHGIVGLMRAYANYLAPRSIRVNSVHPTGVRTPMVLNDATLAFLAQEHTAAGAATNALPVDMVEPEDISNAVLWLASDAARYVTGVALPVDAGYLVKR